MYTVCSVKTPPEHQSNMLRKVIFEIKKNRIFVYNKQNLMEEK